MKKISLLKKYCRAIHSESQKGSVPIFATMTLTTAFLFMGHQQLNTGITSITAEKNARVSKLARSFIYSGFKAIDQIFSQDILDTGCEEKVKKNGNCGKLKHSKDGKALASYLKKKPKEMTMFNVNKQEFSYEFCQIYQLGEKKWSNLFETFNEEKCKKTKKISYEKERNLTKKRDGLDGIVLKNKKISAKKLLGLKSKKYKSLEFEEYAKSDVINNIDGCEDSDAVKTKRVVIVFPATKRNDKKICIQTNKDEKWAKKNGNECGGAVCGRYTQDFVDKNHSLFKEGWSATYLNENEIFTGRICRIKNFKALNDSFYYDDGFSLNSHGIVLASGRLGLDRYTKKTEHSVTFYKWDFDKIRGKDYLASNGCGINTNTNGCIIPDTETLGNLKVNLTKNAGKLLTERFKKKREDYFEKIANKKSNWGKEWFESNFQRALDLKLVATGDNNWDRDCKHEGISIEVTIDYIDPANPEKYLVEK